MGLLDKSRLNNKGIYFTIDSIIGSGIILVVILLASSNFVSDQPSFHLNYVSHDLINSLSAINVKEIDNEYLNERISNGDITNLENSVLEQIGEFWANGDLDFANESFRNVSIHYVSNITGLGLWINNETVYEKNIMINKYLISTKKIVSGVSKGQIGGLTRQNPPTLWGPALFEVRVWE